MQKLHSLPTAIVALTGSLLLAAVFGAARAATVRIWMRDGQPWVRGNLLLVVVIRAQRLDPAALGQVDRRAL